MIKRPSLLVICAVSLFAVRAATAQGVPKQPCPTISVSCPADFKDGEPIKVTASVIGGDPNIVPVYVWSVSTGKIIEGQGSPTITVAPNDWGGKSFTGTVTVSGFDQACPVIASCSFINEHNVPPSRRFASYGARPRNMEIGRLSAFAVELHNQPGALGYLLVYPGRRGPSSEAKVAAARAKEYLVKAHGLDAGRIVTVNGGVKEALTIELWVVPTGAMLPVASPPVDRSPVTLKRRMPSIKPRRKSWIPSRFYEI